MSDSFAGVVLAAGRGTRMGSDVPKVLLQVAGRPLVEWTLEVLWSCGLRRVCVVVSPESEGIRALLGDRVSYAVQPEASGTGDAARRALDSLGEDTPHVILACGDSPLFRSDTAKALMREHLGRQAAVTLTSATLDNPVGYGRIVREHGGGIVRICEEKVAGESERRIKEVNGGLYAFDAGWLRAQLVSFAALGAQRSGGSIQAASAEFVLTEVVEMAVQSGREVASVTCHPDEIGGANTPLELEAVQQILISRRHIQEQEAPVR